MTTPVQQCSQPKDLLCVTAQAPVCAPMDTITCAAERAQGVLCLLRNQFEAEQGQRLTKRVIPCELCDVCGTLEQTRTLAVHADDSTRHDAEWGRK